MNAMKKLLVSLSIAGFSFLSIPSFAQSQTVEKKIYRPFRYETPCALQAKDEFLLDQCTVIETRETGGALRTRNIFSNRFSLTIKSRFDKEKGFMTWDSHNKFEYKFDYRVGGVEGTEAWSYVMPGFLLRDVSWD